MSKKNRITTVTAANTSTTKDTAIFTPDTAPIVYPDTQASSDGTPAEDVASGTSDPASDESEDSSSQVVVSSTQTATETLTKGTEKVYPESFLTNKISVHITGKTSPTGKQFRTIRELIELTLRNVGLYSVRVPSSTFAVLVDILTNSTVLVGANVSDADRLRAIGYLTRDNAVR